MTIIPVVVIAVATKPSTVIVTVDAGLLRLGESRPGPGQTSQMTMGATPVVGRATAQSHTRMTSTAGSEGEV